MTTEDLLMVGSRRRRKVPKKFIDEFNQHHDGEDFDPDYSEDDDEEERQPKRKKKSNGSASYMPHTSRKRYEANKKPKFDPKYIAQLHRNYPDDYWLPSEEGEMIEYINKKHPLSLHTTLTHRGSVFAIAFSPDCEVLASCSNLGTIKLWDATTWQLITEMRDTEEENIEEFYTMCWSDDGRHLIAAGKLKNRKRWSEQDDDNEILPCPLKVFDVTTQKVVARLEGHQEEVLCMKKLKFKGESYLLTASEDGRIIKWHMSPDYSFLIEKRLIDDLSTNMSIFLHFVPKCGNKYFIGACDDSIKLYDFEYEKLVDSWPALYSYLCDCVKFVECKELEAEEGEHFLVSKGVELLKEDSTTEVLYPNKCFLHKLILPKTSRDKWMLEEICRFDHPGYLSNYWLLRLTSNGRYLLAPTTQGKIFIWNLRTTELTGVIKGHSGEVRDTVFHPFKKVLVTCGDDGKINVYYQNESKSENNEEIEIQQQEQAQLQDNHTVDGVTSQPEVIILDNDEVGVDNVVSGVADQDMKANEVIENDDEVFINIDD